MTNQVSASTVIKCAPEIVYGLVADLPGMGRWSPENTGGRWLTGNGPVRGARFVGRNTTGRRTWTTMTTVTAAEPPHRFAFKVTAPLVPIARWEYLIEAVEDGCRVEERWVDLRNRAVRLLSAARTGVSDRAPFTRRSIEQTLAKLKHAAEVAA
ncbi:MAG TPA: SRPBCC family protein [Jatrophihabitans sp.]